MSKVGGVYERISGDDRCQVEAVTGGGEINEVAMDAEFNDFADAMNQVFWRDGSATMTGNLDVNGNNLVGLDVVSAIASTITFNDNTVINGTLVTSDQISVTSGGASLTGAVNVNGELTVTLGDVLLNEGLTGYWANFTGDVSVAGTLTANLTGNVTGDISTDSIQFTGGTPECTGVPTFVDGLVSDSDVTLNGGLYLNGLLEINSTPPASASATGSAGTITYDADFLYFCAATNEWGRIPKQWTNTSLAFTKQTVSGTGTQAVDLNDGWLIDTTISGSQDIEFSNGAQGVNGIIKLINTNGNTFDLSGTGLTFKRSNNGVLETYAQITLQSGASTEQVITFHFQSDTEVIYTVT